MISYNKTFDVVSQFTTAS